MTEKDFKADFAIGQYRDETHLEDPDGLMVSEHGYKYRLLEGVVMPPYVTPERFRRSRTIATRAGDICYSSYPKSGSTWLAYLLVLISNQGRLPEDKGTLRDCLHWVESSWTYPRSAEELEALPSPRIFKSHMPYHMALGGDPTSNLCKYVYIARNPKDVAVSYYYFESQKSWSGHYDGSWEHWLGIFEKGQVQRGSWFDHVLSLVDPSRRAECVVPPLRGPAEGSRGSTSEIGCVFLATRWRPAQSNASRTWRPLMPCALSRSAICTRSKNFRASFERAGSVRGASSLHQNRVWHSTHFTIV